MELFEKAGVASEKGMISQLFPVQVYAEKQKNEKNF